MPVTTGAPAWVIVIGCPNTVRCAVRSGPVFWVNEKLTTPLATLGVSQGWSLVGAYGPVSGWPTGSTGSCREADPVDAPTLTAVPGTNARVSFLIPWPAS